MKQIVMNSPLTDNYMSEVMNETKINIRDKTIMRKRVAETKLTNATNILIENWEPSDDSLLIVYQFSESLFGEILIGSTAKGICFLGFTRNDRNATLHDLQQRFPLNKIAEGATVYNPIVMIQMNNPKLDLPIQLHLKGTQYQLAIWKKLLQVPLGGLTTYSDLAGNQDGARAVGSAVGSNPVGVILPCHRVIHKDGSFNHYFWGSELKEKLLTWEAFASSLV